MGWINGECKMKTDEKRIIVPDFMIMFKAIEKGNNQKSVLDIYYETLITYSHLHNLKKTFVKKDWITIKKEGRKHILILTHKGKEIVELINLLLNKLKITEDDIMKYRRQRNPKAKILTKKPKEEEGEEYIAWLKMEGENDNNNEEF